MSNNVFCNQCGQQLPPTSRFCNGCGAQIAGGASLSKGSSASPARAPSEIEDEHDIFTVRPTMLFVMIWYGVAVAIVLAVSVLLGIMSSQDVQFARDYWYIVLLGVGLVAFAIPIYKHILRRREVYTLTNYKLEMRYGIIAKSLRNIPLNKIQDVTVTASVWQRLLRLGDIVIDSASETGRIHLDDIHNPDRYANMILAELRRRN